MGPRRPPPRTSHRGQSPSLTSSPINQYSVSSLIQIVDIGCGEGQLLAVLCQPAPSLPPPSPSPSQSPSPTEAPPTTLSDGDLDLHPTHITGLDISPHALTSAIEDTSPTTANTSYTRWEPLKVDIWHGGLEIYNPAFVNAECIVATEVYVSSHSHPTFSFSFF
jgi:hypothetical protein